MGVALLAGYTEMASNRYFIPRPSFIKKNNSEQKK